MLTVNLGPLALASHHLLLIASLALASVVGARLGRRAGSNPETPLLLLLLLGLLVARLAFVLVYAEHFAGAWWRVLDIRDGGFIAWPGVLAALLAALWLLWRRAALRRPLAAALLAGLALWGLGSLVLGALERSAQLPALALRDLQGRPVELQALRGEPLVVNLWATWCPPCRREMPVLDAARRREPGIRFVFVNQGEGAGEVARFLAGQRFDTRDVLLDGGGRLGALVGSRALPTTLFYGADGRLLGTHLGELSDASLAQALDALRSGAHK